LEIADQRPVVVNVLWQAVAIFLYLHRCFVLGIKAYSVPVAHATPSGLFDGQLAAAMEQLL
jgi:hypothetical protein